MTPARWLVAILAVAGLVAVAVLRRQPMPAAELPARYPDEGPDGIQPPDPGLWRAPQWPPSWWAPAAPDPRCTCPDVWQGVIPPPCPVHNPPVPVDYWTFTDTGTTVRERIR